MLNCFTCGTHILHFFRRYITSKSKNILKESNRKLWKAVCKTKKIDKVFTKCKRVFWPSDSRMINVEDFLVHIPNKQETIQEYMKILGTEIIMPYFGMFYN